jgi:hypothetical protein
MQVIAQHPALGQVAVLVFPVEVEIREVVAILVEE